MRSQASTKREPIWRIRSSGRGFANASGWFSRSRDAPRTRSSAAPTISKLHSSLTLFAQASDDAIFSLALKKYFGGELDRATMERLR